MAKGGRLIILTLFPRKQRAPLFGNLRKSVGGIRHFPLLFVFWLNPACLRNRAVQYIWTEAMPIINSRREPSMHAIKILGWGEDRGVDYWIVENSFGPTWGQNGYGYIKKSGKHDQEYNPMIGRDVVVLENFVIATTPANENLIGPAVGGAES